MSDEKLNENSETNPASGDSLDAENNADVKGPKLVKPRRRWLRRSLQLFLVVLIFISGMIVGGTMAMQRMHHRMKNFEHDRPEIVNRIHHRITHKYHLNEEQSSKAKEIIEQHIDEVIAVRQEVRPRIEAQLQQFEEEIAELMDESQREEWRNNVRHFGRRLFPRF